MMKILVKNLFLFAVTVISLIILATVTTASSIPQQPNLAKSQREGTGFRLLGTLEKPRTVVDAFGVTSVIKEDWDYSESVNAAGWAEAKRDCEANGDTLLYMETKEEIGNVTKWLQDTDNTGHLYWVGGRYFVREEEFIWDNGVKFRADAPWGKGEPKDKLPDTRVVASVIGRVIEFQTDSSAIRHRFICEGQRQDS